VVDRGARTLTIPDTKNGDPAVRRLRRAGVADRTPVEGREVKRPDSTVLLSPWIFHLRGNPFGSSAGLRHRPTAAGVPTEGA